LQNCNESIEGKSVKTLVLPGPDNPGGHGCISIISEHIERFFEKVEINTRGELI
jgi:hypothetical protein